jgi:hypothetical protein
VIPVSGRFRDDHAFGLEWIADRPQRLERASHALTDGGRVWLVDPVEVDGLEERLAALGAVAGVIQLLGRHGRDCATLAARHGVPHWTGTDWPGTPFRPLRIVDWPLWHERALWWPERRTLVVADALGSASYFPAPGQRLGVHPFLRPLPPRSLTGLDPEHVLCGHGAGVHGPAAATALAEALETARRGIPRWLAGFVRRRRASGL